MIKDVPGSKCYLKNSTDGAVRPNASEKELNQVSGNPVQMPTALKVIFQKLTLALNLLSYHIRSFLAATYATTRHISGPFKLSRHLN